MSIIQRSFGKPGDFDRIGQFLIRHYQPGNRNGNWLQPAWEYMHFHPLLNESALDRIGIWEDDGEIAAVVHYEWRLGEAFFQLRSGYAHLKAELLDYAEVMLFDQFESGPRYLDAYINSTDPAFTALVQGRGYRPIPSHDRPLAAYAIPNPFPTIELPEGFSLKSLAEETDWARVHQVLWRGFDNQGDPPAGEEELESRRKMFETPNANLDLKIVVQAPNGDFAALCGMWYEPTNHYAYVEPVATDPTYRRLGLGRAAVLEGIRRCGERGATVAYVGSDQPFYLSFGFEVIYNSRCWQRNWE